MRDVKHRTDNKLTAERSSPGWIPDYGAALRLLKAEHAALNAERTHLDQASVAQQHRISDLESRIRGMHHQLQDQWTILNQRMADLSRSPSTDRVYGYGEMAAALAHWQMVAQQLAMQIDTLSQLVRVDGLTDLYNRRAFDEFLPREIDRAQRERLPLCLLMIDVDHFKRFNDRHGHPAGDSALRRVALCIRSCVRPSDHAARYGGEEFAIVLSGVDMARGRAVADRVRHQVELLPAEPEALSISIGLAWIDLRSPHGRSTSELASGLLEAADQALYRAKRAGRNRIEVAMDLASFLFDDPDTAPMGVPKEDSLTTQPMAAVPPPRSSSNDSLITQPQRAI
jgi:diguanylate cyclase (GGDEF)-like protein